jgi:dihydrofolate reductase
VTATIAMIAAVARNGVIGDKGRIPWRLPSDFAWFKRKTVGKPLIMGRLTFEGLGKPLPDRTNIVISRTPGYRAEGAVVVPDLTDALARAREIAKRDGADEIMVGGGGEIYREAMPFTGRLYITHVDAEPEGDTRFPDIDPTEWEAVEEIDIPPTDRDSTTFRVVRYERR